MLSKQNLVVVALWRRSSPFLPATARARAALRRGERRVRRGPAWSDRFEARVTALIETNPYCCDDDQRPVQIVDLRPGTYSVTFTLVVSARSAEDIVLTAGFTQAVNAT